MTVGGGDFLTHTVDLYDVLYCMQAQRVFRERCGTQ